MTRKTAANVIRLGLAHWRNGETLTMSEMGRQALTVALEALEELDVGPAWEDGLSDEELAWMDEVRKLTDAQLAHIIRWRR